MAVKVRYQPEMKTDATLGQHGIVTADAPWANPATHFAVTLDPGGLTHQGPAQDGMAISIDMVTVGIRFLPK
jgi:hypothetical protein